MNLFFRLFHVFIFSKFRPSLKILEICATPFRVWPTDLDILRHMNNGVYFSLQDLARTDYMIRIQAADQIEKLGWYPVVASETIRFRKSLKCFQAFEIQTRLITWDEKYLYLEHKFVSQKEVMALGMIRARFLKKTGGSVSPQDLINALDLKIERPEFPQYVQDWLNAELLHSNSTLVDSPKALS